MKKLKRIPYYTCLFFKSLRQYGVKATASKVIQKICRTINKKTSSYIMHEKNITLIRNFEEYDEFVRRVKNEEGFDVQNIAAYLNSFKLDFSSFVEAFGSPHPDCDPFSQEYIDWEMAFLTFLSGKKYEVESEGILKAEAEHFNKEPTGFHWTLQSRTTQMRTYADFLDICKPKKGMKALEMGCGWGNLLELLGRCGCHVTGLDVSEAAVKYLRDSLTSQRIPNEMICGTFSDIEKTDTIFDMVVFEASIHHSNDPLNVLKALYNKMHENSKLYFLNECISELYDRPWGVVLHYGEALYQIRYRGWLEFGLRLDFFEELLKKANLTLQDQHVLSNGTVLYVAVKALEEN